MRLKWFAGAMIALTHSSAIGGQPLSGWQSNDMEQTCAACRDFYRYANGGWLARQHIPEGRAVWSSYDEADERVRADLKQIVDDAQRAATAGDQGTLGKIGTFYKTCMDKAAADRDGAAPVAADLEALRKAKSMADITALIRRLDVRLPEMLFATSVEADAMHPERMMLHFWQGGLSLPEASLYSDTGKEGAEARAMLVSTAARMFGLSGMTQAEANENAVRVLTMETELAAASRSAEGLRDQRENYHPFTLAEARALTPHWDWAAYISEIGAPATAPIDIAQPEFFRAVENMLTRHPPADWSAYVQWRLLKGASPWLSKPFRDARDAFSAHFSGAKGASPREVNCNEALNYAMGRAVGQIYLKRTFTPEARIRGERMVANLVAAMAQRIREARWMTPATRQKALRKLSTVKVYLGGPTRVPDYSLLKVTNGPFWANMSRGYAFVTYWYTDKLRRPSDRGDWYKLAQDVSGGADFERNAFQYPAGKFQPPFFDPKADDALNYGALGATMGHELTHLFDDRGREHDENGKLRDWWTPADVAAYKKRSDSMVAQFTGYRVNGEKVNGKLTVSENIADLGGLTIAYYALQRELAGKPRKRIDGFTPEQRFFLAWARNFRQLQTPDRLRRQVRSDEHSPSLARVNGPLSNMAEFDQAFGCKPGDAMYRSPRERVRIW